MGTTSVGNVAPLRDVDDKVSGEEWVAVRPTRDADDTCDDLLRMIEKDQRVPLLLDHLADCQVVLPELHCLMLGLAGGTTYADAVRALRGA